MIETMLFIILSVIIIIIVTKFVNYKTKEIIRMRTLATMLENEVLGIANSCMLEYIEILTFDNEEDFESHIRFSTASSVYTYIMGKYEYYSSLLDTYDGTKRGKIVDKVVNEIIDDNYSELNIIEFYRQHMEPDGEDDITEELKNEEEPINTDDTKKDNTVNISNSIDNFYN